MKKPFGLGGEAVVCGVVVVLTVFGELDLAEPQAAASIASATPTAARHADLRYHAIGTNSGIPANAKQAASLLSANLRQSPPKRTEER